MRGKRALENAADVAAKGVGRPQRERVVGADGEKHEVGGPLQRGREVLPHEVARGRAIAPGGAPVHGAPGARGKRFGQSPAEAEVGVVDTDACGRRVADHEQVQGAGCSAFVTRPAAVDAAVPGQRRIRKPRGVTPQPAPLRQQHRRLRGRDRTAQPQAARRSKLDHGRESKARG